MDVSVHMIPQTMKIALDEGAFAPVREHFLDAGLDLRTPVDFVVPAHSWAFVKTGVHVQLPPSTRGHVCSRSGLNRDHGLTADGTIDEGYTGSIGVTIHNSSNEDYKFYRGDKVAQLVVEVIMRPVPVLSDVESFEKSERGDDGFGSTGA